MEVNNGIHYSRITFTIREDTVDLQQISFKRIRNCGSLYEMANNLYLKLMFHYMALVSISLEAIFLQVAIRIHVEFCGKRMLSNNLSLI